MILWWNYFIMSVGEALLCLEIGRTDASNFNVSLSHHALVTRTCVFQSAWKLRKESKMRTHLSSGLGGPGFEFWLCHFLGV